MTIKFCFNVAFVIQGQTGWLVVGDEIAKKKHKLQSLKE